MTKDEFKAVLKKMNGIMSAFDREYHNHKFGDKTAKKSADRAIPVLKQEAEQLIKTNLN